VRGHQRFLLASRLVHLEFLGEQIKQLNQRIVAHIERMSSPRLCHPTAVAFLDTILVIGQSLAEAILAEAGADMGRFSSTGHMASWADVARGKDKSIGKRHPGKISPCNPALRKALVEAAKARVLRTPTSAPSAIALPLHGTGSA